MPCRVTGRSATLICVFSPTPPYEAALGALVAKCFRAFEDENPHLAALPLPTDWPCPAGPQSQPESPFRGAHLQHPQPRSLRSQVSVESAVGELRGPLGSPLPQDTHRILLEKSVLQKP
jgi:hypothetical protein